MSFLNSEDKFQCCLLYPDEPEKILLGTINGYVYLGKLKPIEEIKTINFEDKRMSSVLDEFRAILKLRGVIRSMEFIDSNNIIILTNQGEIVNYDRKTETNYFIQNYRGTSYNRPWRLLILDENNFITIGNYRKIKHWFKDKNRFKYDLLNEGGYPLFCIDWIDLEKKKFLINGNDGHSSIWNYIEGNSKKISDFYSDKNLQKCFLTDNGLIFSVNYFGNFYIYKLDNQRLKRIEQYSISLSQGNWVYYSNGMSLVLIGTDECLIMITENLDQLWKLNIECKQIIGIEDFDLILTSKTIVRPNYSKKQEITDYQDYKYIKIGLVGDSRVGKTCFCKYLETDEFQDTKSSFGKHVWTIKLDKKRRILYYDLAGQGSELYTYFPLIKDSEIILLFYNGLLKESFDKIIEYYEELRTDCIDTEFYFVQTYSSEDPDRLIKDWYIKKEFNKVSLEFEKNLIKIDSSNGMGFDEYKENVIDEIDWNNTNPVYKSKTYDNVENEINELYNIGKQIITLNDLQKEIRLNKKFLKHIIRSFKNQGKIEYIGEEEEIIINDELYEKMHSLISEKIDGNDGFLETKQILTCLGTDKVRLKYIRSILEYYRENQICLFFSEGNENNEVIIVDRKLKDDLKIPNTIKDKIPTTKTILYYKNVPIDLSSLIHFLSEFKLDIIRISKREILLKNQFNSNLIKLTYNEDVKIEDESAYSFITALDKKDESDYEFEKILLKFLLEMIENNLIDYSYKEDIDQKIEFESFEEELIYLLKKPFESPYLDFKTLINIKSSQNKAEIIKDITALTNSSYLNNNISYLLVGFVEEKFKIKKIINVDSIEDLENFITQTCRNYLDPYPNIEFIPQKIYQLYEWQKNGEISSAIPLSDIQSDPDSEQAFLIIRITRSPNSVCEVVKDLKYEKKGKDFFHREGASWFRVSSHTFRLRDFHRVILRKK